MGLLPTVKIRHPEIEGEFCIINEADFQEGVHTRWVDGTGTSSKTPVAADEIPDGCSVEHRGGGRYHALVGDKHLKEGDSDEPATFQGKAAAIAALQAYAAAAAEAAAGEQPTA